MDTSQRETEEETRGEIDILQGETGPGIVETGLEAGEMHPEIDLGVEEDKEADKWTSRTGETQHRAQVELVISCAIYRMIGYTRRKKSLETKLISGKL